MEGIEQQYLNLLQDILDNGQKTDDRTGTCTISVFGRTLRHNMKDGFPLLTTKRLSIHNIKHELLWFLQGSTRPKYLIENNIHIWTPDLQRFYRDNATIHDYYHTINNLNEVKKYTLSEFENMILTDEIFENEYGDLGPTYGHQWRSWEGKIDQISVLINQLRNNPDSRRLIVSAWNVSDIGDVVLPPCHHMFQCKTRVLSVEEREEIMASRGFGYPSTETREEQLDEYNIPKRELSLIWNQRSVDTFLGLPYNLASYGLLLQLLSDEVGMQPGELIGFLADTHIYSNHVDQVNEQMLRTPYKLPTVSVTNGISAVAKDIKLIDYNFHEAISAPLSVG